MYIYIHLDVVVQSQRWLCGVLQVEAGVGDKWQDRGQHPDLHGRPDAAVLAALLPLWQVAPAVSQCGHYSRVYRSLPVRDDDERCQGEFSTCPNDRWSVLKITRTEFLVRVLDPLSRPASFKEPSHAHEWEKYKDIIHVVFVHPSTNMCYVAASVNLQITFVLDTPC